MPYCQGIHSKFRRLPKVIPGFKDLFITRFHDEDDDEDHQFTPIFFSPVLFSLLLSFPILAKMLSRQILRAARVATPARTQLRTYAAAAAADSKPPVAVFGLDGTYASALYTAAVKTSSLDATAKAVASLDSMFAKDSKLSTILSAPTLSDSDKSSIVTELLKAAGTSDVTTKNFLHALAENNRLNLLEGAVSKFAILMSAARGEVEMTVTSAQPLEGKLLNRLESAVTKSAYVGKGKTLKVKNEVNPDILGGLIVEIGDKTIDLSVSAKVAKLNKLLTESL
ncbi:hypothetical protein BROUX41_000518 [Berkeleyomyces rouxiae]|uniref:uncharacterized protein n=1 Tax=Berkeleyomyces rouxiae TaxID=2035830 RepID=UPI003B7BAA94